MGIEFDKFRVWLRLERSAMPVNRPRPRMVEEALRAGEKRYRILVEHLPVGVYRTTPDGKIIEANPALCRMLGTKNPAGLLNYNVEDFYVKKEDRSRHLVQLAEKPRSFTEFELRSTDGRKFWVRDYCQAVKSPDGTLLFCDGILVDITERKRAEKKLEHALQELQTSNEKLKSLSLTDDLTGLSNRRGFFTLGQQQMKIAKRIRKDVFLLYMDVDELKQTNDTYGHPAGDRVLTTVALILRETLRESDIIARIGGDEFAVLAIRSHRGGEKVLFGRLEEKLRAYNLKNPKRLHLSLSMGIVRFDPRKFSSLEDFLAHADYLMYQQKRSKVSSQT
jgi:diguanylate cyclase (GGDEF)-like protein/PAS domain S-box-containing protein